MYTILLMMSAPTMASSFYPFVAEPVSVSRTDAPSDGVVVWSANIDADATLRFGTTEVVLALEPMTGVGAVPRAVVAAPAGGWPVGVPLVVEAHGFDETDVESFSFQAVSGIAGPPPAVSTTVTVTPWTEDETYPWGCCTDVREVQFDLDITSGDAWDGVEVRGRFEFDEPTQITEEPIQSQLGLEVGLGVHQVRLTQWMDDGVPQPPCFDVHGRSAAGELGPAETFCLLERPDGSSYTPSEPVDDAELVSAASAGGNGCSTVRTPAGMAGFVALLLACGRRRNCAPVTASA